MIKNSKSPFYDEDTNEFLGFIVSDGTNWQVQTIFGYLIARTNTRIEAERTLYQEGSTYLKGIWQYYDKDDKDWFPCVIKKAFEHQVIVNRTNTLGFQDEDNSKQVIIEDPTDSDLVKSS
ncbi:MAG: hypothetical protein JWN75_632 [Candidatus Saccharibacteria bacterium]|nr:hypothetical protein [Candidatus Saccharibacteria bacterium]